VEGVLLFFKEVMMWYSEDPRWIIMERDNIIIVDIFNKRSFTGKVETDHAYYVLTNNPELSERNFVGEEDDWPSHWRWGFLSGALNKEGNVKIKVKLLHKDASIPQYMTDNAAGMDLASLIDCVLMPGEYKLIPTGISIELPARHEGQIRPRSGLAVKHGIMMPNAPGTIDEDYRGEIKVSLINLGKDLFNIKVGMRIAQLVVAPVVKVDIELVDKLSVTGRDSGGFGHTGI
jgi:dUTP pyrophosphatase